MTQRFDGYGGGGGGGASSDSPHVAQQSRRDKLRVQSHQLGHDPNPNPSPDFVYTSAMLPSSGILDFSSPTNNNGAPFLSAGSCDWIINCVGGGGGGMNNCTTPSSASSMYGDQYNLHFASPSPYHNTLQEVVAPSGASPQLGNHGIEMMGSLPPPPPTLWHNHRQLQQQQQYPGLDEGNDQFVRSGKPERGFFGVSGTSDHQTHHQGLSLSLASNSPPSQLHIDAGFPCPAGPSSPAARGHGVVVVGMPTDPGKLASGPLGPFTGYATILKSSKFLKPAQRLLDEFCGVVTGSRASREVGNCAYRVLSERGSSAGASVSNASCGLIGGDEGMNFSGGRGGDNSACVSSSSFFSSTEGGSCSEVGMIGETNSEQVRRRPEIQQKKVKLLYLQEEVCRRYKQYHQQMQMVVSSFETVAGLSASTPYTSLAVKSVSKHFRCLKNAISDELHQVSKLLGEELLSSPSSSSRGGETMITPRLKYVDQSLTKQRGSGNSCLGFLDNNQPVWRPQRGLPERAVAVLRAWLFEHFLHPYPTDTDKHMLATQTGLSRNQVSNWFINARVRLWKPMVEEIHSLESKGMSDMNLNSSNKNEGKSVMEKDGRHGHHYPDQLSEAKSNKALDCSSIRPVASESNSIGMEQWHREKRMRMEDSAIPQSIDGGLLSFAYQGGMDLGGLGAVSLTLGLRHSEGPQQQMRRFGSQMLHDFVG